MTTPLIKPLFTFTLGFFFIPCSSEETDLIPIEDENAEEETIEITDFTAYGLNLQKLFLTMKRWSYPII